MERSPVLTPLLGAEERHPREGWRAGWEPTTTTGSPSCITFARCRQVQSLCSAPGGSSGRSGPHFSCHGGLGLGDAPVVGPSASQIGTLGAQGSGAPSGPDWVRPRIAYWALTEYVAG